MLGVRSAWHLRKWDEGSVAWNAITGDTHALDPLTAEVLEASRLHGTPDVTLAAQLSQRLGLALDETLEHVILTALDRIRQLEAT
ncbi:HPr-rel-A system PqqD family peptide chaperone [Viridibacterium curvum]|uniref:ANTAR domain-containing protein n=1 Tax=Viridibacterium curvum TaxID=1101404 RepID=A0ABP9QKC7_9RHOO